jgi:hypothetical protein
MAYTIKCMNTNDIALLQPCRSKASDEFADESVRLRCRDRIGRVGAIDVNLFQISKVDLIIPVRITYRFIWIISAPIIITPRKYILSRNL